MILHGIEYQRPTSLNMRILADHVTYSFLAFMKSIFHFCLGCYCGGYSQNGRSNLSSSICNVLGMPILMSVSKTMQVFSKFYFHDTLEQDQRAWEQQGLIGPISTIRLGLPCGQGWGENFSPCQPPKDNSVGTGVVWVTGLFSLWGLPVGYETWPPIGWRHSFVIGWSKDRLGLPSAPLHYRLTWPVGIPTVFQTSVTDPLHSPNGRQLAVVRAV